MTVALRKHSLSEMIAHLRRNPTRRQVLGALASLAALGMADDASPLPLATEESPAILPRNFWAEGLPTPPSMELEDVKFLLVHHTGSPDSNYELEDVIGLLRSIHAFHTGPEKQWPDVAYNFFVDKFGRIIEARAGSIDGPIQGSATGGNQGFSQLCCFLGNMATEPPTPEAQASMAWLLAWLANRHAIELEPDSTTSFVSRGSNRWPAGVVVETTTIAGHRDMSLTECPGDACYGILRTDIAAAARSRTAEPTTTTMTAVVSTSSPPSSLTSTTVQPAQIGSTTLVSPSTAADVQALPESVTNADSRGSWPVPPIAVAVLGTCVAALVGLRVRTARNDQSMRSLE